MRFPAARVKPMIAKHANFPAPVGGWIANVSLATPGARLPDGRKVNGASVLENYFPTATAVRMRGGSQRHAVIGDSGLPVTSLFSYISGSTSIMFAANENAIYDVTSPLYSEEQFLVDGDGNFLVDGDGNFLIESGSPDPSVTGTSGGNWSVVQFQTSGGTYLRLVNGVDTPLVFDGTGFSTSPAITGATPTTLSYVWAYKNRLFFIQRDSLDVWYLPVDSIGGAAVKFPMGAIFNRGGTLMFGASWSLDTGGGLSEQCVFVTSEGEVAVYQGGNPGDANDWTRVGVYRIGRPRGPKAFIRAGGDIVIATDVGFIPLSQAVQRDYAVLAPGAVSYPIEDAWTDAVENRSGSFWHCEVWPTKQMVVVALPTATGQQKQMFVSNARTGAWAKYTGWGATAVIVYGNRFFFGQSDGRVIEGDITGADGVYPYTSTCVPLFDPLREPASIKTGMQARCVFRSPYPVRAKLSLQADYGLSLPSAPDALDAPGGSLWGSGTWGTATWGETAEPTTEMKWKSVPGSGYSLSVAVQISSGSTPPPNVEIVQIDLTYDVGDVGS